MRAARNIIGLVVALALSGCALAVNGSQPQTFDLIAPDVSAAAGAPLPVQIVVNTPNALRALNTERILVRPRSERISYYPDAVWSDRLPQLVRARLTEVLEDSGRFRAVVTEDDRVTSSYGLQLSIRAFELSVNGKPPEGHVAISAKIVDERAGKVVATRQFESRVRASSDAVGEGIAAITKAFQDVSRALVDWMTTGRGRSRLSAGS